MMNQIKVVAGLFACAMLTSCTTSRSSRWAVHEPKDDLDVWNAPITIAMSNVTSDAALAIVEAAVLKETGEEITLAYGQLPESWGEMLDEPDEASLPRITFSASNIPPWQAVSIIADLTGARTMYHKRTGVLAPFVHGDGSVTVLLTGRCVDAASGEVVPSFDAATQFQEVTPDASGVYRVPLEVGGYVNSYYVDGRSCYSETHPNEREINMIVSAPGYEPGAVTFKLHHGSLVYTNDIRLRKQTFQQSVGGDSGKAAEDGVPTGAPQR